MNNQLQMALRSRPNCEDFNDFTQPNNCHRNTTITRKLLINSNIVKAQNEKSYKFVQRDGSHLICEYQNNLWSEKIKKHQQQCTDKQRERRLRRKHRALSWVFAFVFCPCWCFYSVARTWPDVDDQDDLDEELSRDFCCPCYYQG